MTTNNADPKQPGSDPQAAAAEEQIIKTELYLPSILGYEKIARGAAQALAEQIELPPARIEDLKTAVAEACMNAIEHGNSLKRGINVTVMMLITRDKLEVRVADIGVQHIPDPLPKPGTSASMRGWGMFFIKNLVDEMEIKRLPEGGNEVRMVIRLAPADQDAEQTESAQSSVAPTGEKTPGEIKPEAVTMAKKKIQPAEEKPHTVQPVEQKPSAVQPSEQKPGAVQPAEKKPHTVQPVEQKPSAVTPAQQKPGAVQSSEQKPSAVQPVEKKPNAVSPAESKPGAVIATKTGDDTKPGAKSAGADDHSPAEK